MPRSKAVRHIVAHVLETSSRRRNCARARARPREASARSARSGGRSSCRSALARAGRSSEAPPVRFVASALIAKRTSAARGASGRNLSRPKAQRRNPRARRPRGVFTEGARVYAALAGRRVFVVLAFARIASDRRPAIPPAELTRFSAISVRVLSVFFSSLNVSSSSLHRLLVISSLLGPGLQRAVAGDLVVLHSLRGGQKPGVERLAPLELLHHLLAFFHQPHDRVAGFRLGVLFDYYKNPARRGPTWLLGLRQMLLEGGPELVRVRRLRHLRQSASGSASQRDRCPSASRGKDRSETSASVAGERCCGPHLFLAPVARDPPRTDFLAVVFRPRLRRTLPRLAARFVDCLAMGVSPCVLNSPQTRGYAYCSARDGRFRL